MYRTYNSRILRSGVEGRSSHYSTPCPLPCPRMFFFLGLPSLFLVVHSLTSCAARISPDATKASSVRARIATGIAGAWPQECPGGPGGADGADGAWAAAVVASFGCTPRISCTSSWPFCHASSPGVRFLELRACESHPAERRTCTILGFPAAAAACNAVCPRAFAKREYSIATSEPLTPLVFCSLVRAPSTMSSLTNL